MMTKAAYFVRFLEVLAEKREEERNERWVLQRTNEGGNVSSSPLSNHCALPILRAGKISVARNLIPAGSGQQSWMATERQGVHVRS